MEYGIKDGEEFHIITFALHRDLTEDEATYS